jgi:hypothetical protein
LDGLLRLLGRIDDQRLAKQQAANIKKLRPSRARLARNLESAAARQIDS